jgi:hypothetical protein
VLNKRRDIADKHDDKWFDAHGWKHQFINAHRFAVLQSTMAARTSTILAGPAAAIIFHAEGGKTSYRHGDNVIPTTAWANKASKHT